MYLDSSAGQLDGSVVTWLKDHLSSDDIVEAGSELVLPLSQSGLNVAILPEDRIKEFNRNRLQFVVSSSLAASIPEAEGAIREVSLQISDLKIKEKSSKPDLQAMEAVQALDEVDKTVNIMSSRVREWYGLHFPELTSMIDDNVSLIKLVLTFKTRENYVADELEKMGFSKNKSSAIETSARQSRGAELREADISRIVQLAEEAQRLFSLRDGLSSHVERTMKQVAPNLSEVAGASIGARLIARAGGLEKLAIMPASTIQILGAEKALYRALKSGSRPPKHGILFQHAEVHGAPKWQRGKIARSVAGKIAIASRVDLYRGTKDESVMKSLQARLDEIRTKYKEAPKERPPSPPQRRREEYGGAREFKERPRQRGTDFKRNRRERRRDLQGKK